MPSGSVGRSGVMASAISAAIRGHMGRQRLSGNTLAAMAGVSQNYMAKRLRDDAPLTVDDLEAIAAALGVPVKDLVAEAALLAAKPAAPQRPELPAPGRKHARVMPEL